MDNRILCHRGWRVTDGLVGSFEMLRAEQRLRDACSSGNRETLKEVTQQLSVENLDKLLNNGKDYPTGTPVFEAILCEQAEILKDLISLGCDLEQECSLDIFFPVHFVDTGPALSVACAMGNLKCASLLLKTGASVNHAGQHSTPLHSACQDGNIELIHLLLENGADVNISPRSLPGYSALHVSALFHDNADVVRLLMAFGANVNSTDQEGHTPVFKACMAANCEVAEALLQHENLQITDEERTKMLWLLGAECVFRLDSPSLAHKYWEWSATWDPGFSIYNTLLDTVLTAEQKKAGIHEKFSCLSDLFRLSQDRQKVDLQALVFLYLVFGWGKETISFLTGQISSAMNKQRACRTCQLLMFSENMAESVASYDVVSVCENISQTVEDLLELFIGQSTQPPDHVHVILNGILNQILKLFEKIVQSPDLSTKKVLKLSHLQCSQVKSKRERAEQLIEAFLGLTNYGYGLSKEDKNCASYKEQLLRFCGLCSRPASVNAKLNCVVWQVTVYGGPCCKHSLTWHHHNLFPSEAIARLLIQSGLDVNCLDDSRNTPLHYSLMCQEPDIKVIETLVENGAELDLPNKDGILPYNILVQNPSFSINVINFTTLKSLAAKTIVRHKVHYRDTLPKTLADFVALRDVYLPIHGLWKQTLAKKN